MTFSKLMKRCTVASDFRVDDDITISLQTKNEPLKQETKLRQINKHTKKTPSVVICGGLLIVEHFIYEENALNCVTILHTENASHKEACN